MAQRDEKLNITYRDVRDEKINFMVQRDEKLTFIYRCSIAQRNEK